MTWSLFVKYFEFSGKYGAKGCEGTSSPDAYFYFLMNEQDGKVMQDSCYPYTGSRGTCQSNLTTCFVENFKMTEYIKKIYPSEEEIKELVYINPVRTGVNVIHRDNLHNLHFVSNFRQFV